MRVFLAGATGVMGVRLVPLLLRAGHAVAGMTRSAGKVDRLRVLGAAPVVCDVYDGAALREAVVGFGAEMVMHQLTDLPDAAEQIPEYRARNNRIRTEGTRNLLAAAAAAGAQRFLAQSIAWRPPGGGEAVDEHERLVLESGGTVVRYGAFYGPDTYASEGVPPHPRIQIDDAARATVELMEAGPGLFTVAEPEE